MSRPDRDEHNAYIQRNEPRPGVTGVDYFALSESERQDILDYLTAEGWTFTRTAEGLLEGYRKGVMGSRGTPVKAGIRYTAKSLNDEALGRITQAESDVMAIGEFLARQSAIEANVARGSR